MDPEIFQKTCRSHGLKVTPQRSAIYREIESSREHPSIDQVYRKVRRKCPHISFDTVYRTLLGFCEAGLLQPVESYGYTKRFDPNRNPHHHLRCIKCHRITDFYDKGYDTLRLPKALPKNFQVLSKKIVLEGLCEKCQP